VAGADGLIIGTGYQNTSDIAAQSGNFAEVSAAVAARAYTGPNNLSDWFLPSRYELNELCKYARNTGQAAGASISCAGGTLRTGFASSYHWSSSELGATTAGSQYFGSGNQSDGSKSYALYVRPVRAF
jgi:hypothetical protein